MVNGLEIIIYLIIIKKEIELGHFFIMIVTLLEIQNITEMMFIGGLNLNTKVAMAVKTIGVVILY